MMSNDRAQPSSRNTHHENSTPDPLPHDALHKFEMIIKVTKFMIWNLTFRMHIPNAMMFNTDTVALAMKAIDKALDLVYHDQYFLVNPQSNTIRPPNTVPDAHSFKMEEYVTSPIPMGESTKLEIQFKIASHDKTKWNLFLPVNKLNDLCSNVKGTISVDNFGGKQSKILGIITEVNVGIFSLHPRWCRFSPHWEVALRRMSLPGGDNPQSLTLTLTLFSPDHSQWDRLHVYLNMIRVVNN